MPMGCVGTAKYKLYSIEQYRKSGYANTAGPKPYTEFSIWCTDSKPDITIYRLFNKATIRTI
jgi:hypothetical protein